jgi:mRNA-degrading endonuclease toxin of MazEF toxin-antitoxin module
VVEQRRAILIRNEARRPRVSANIPVGISKTPMPAANAALAINTPKMSNPAARRKRVLIPQIRAAARG